MIKKKRKPQRYAFPIWQAAMAYVKDHGSALLDEHKSFITGLIRARDYERLAELPDVLAFSYSDANCVRIVRQLSAFFKKDADFADEARCHSEAQKAFEMAEELCKATNLRLTNAFINEARLDDELYLIVNRMRKHVATLVGNLTDLLDSLPKGMKVTSGATSTRPRADSLPYLKVRKKACGTTGATQLFALFQEYSSQRPWDTTVVEGNRIALVPKSYKTHRTIAAEPELNVLFQLAVDAYLKDRLRRRENIDLRDQSRNQSLARQGSVDGSIATIDLSMASDTMAREVVHYLFPTEWCNFLELLRSPRYTGCFGEGEYAKFSSMGNGFTFVLQTTIFTAAAKAIGSKVVSVYGDDIIVDASKYTDMIEVLRFLGFVPNKSKSFAAGPFRESCGGDFFLGVDVRPFFVKKHERLTRPELCHIINGLASISGENLAELLVREVRKAHLPLAPYSENTRAGVHVDVTTCYRLGLILKPLKDPLRGESPWCVYYKGYSERHRYATIRNVKTMILWFLAKQSSSEQCETSRVILSSSAKMTRLCWQIPDKQPIHLYWWSDLLTAP